MGIFDEEGSGTGCGNVKEGVDGGKKRTYRKGRQDERRKNCIGGRSFKDKKFVGNPMSEDGGGGIQRSLGLVRPSAWKRKAIVMIRQDIIMSFICLSCFGFIFGFLVSGVSSLLLVVIYRIVSHSDDSQDKSQR